MKEVSNAHKSIAALFAEESLDPPAVLAWPMDGAAEEDRLRREGYFSAALGAHPPLGMEWIESHVPVKYRPDRILDGCRSVLVVSLGYFRTDPADDPVPDDSLSAGRVARYARGRDYHKELGNRLKRVARRLGDVHPGHDFRAFTDIGPLDETWLAEASGMGFKGRHTLAILPGVGSWTVLGHILSTLPLESVPGRPSPMACPAGCRRCIDACPTGALSLADGTGSAGILNASLCLSYQTIENKGAADASLREAFGDRVFGCDACQEACPFNAKVPPTDVAAFLKDIAGAAPSLQELLSLKDHDDVAALFAGSPLMRAGRAGLVRNACIAAGNAGDRRLLPVLKALAGDDEENEMIREHARWALEHLESVL